jgi:hypothetical protein
LLPEWRGTRFSDGVAIPAVPKFRVLAAFAGLVPALDGLLLRLAIANERLAINAELNSKGGVVARAALAATGTLEPVMNFGSLAAAS